MMLSTKSFFTIYRNLFSRLAHDESSVSDIPYPDFGNSTWPWAATTKADDEEAARIFYSAWINFSTSKDFTWMDRYNISDAPDRRYRRSDLFCHILIIYIRIVSQAVGEGEQKIPGRCSERLQRNS